jgi:hypothetical protein
LVVQDFIGSILKLHHYPIPLRSRHRERLLRHGYSLLHVAFSVCCT